MNKLTYYAIISAWLTGMLSFTAKAQDFEYMTNYNYICSKTTFDNALYSTGDDYLTEVKYYDGLGRPSQVIPYGASPLGRDIIQPVVYDPYGREDKTYLPYAATGKTGVFRTGWETEQSNFYTNTLEFGTTDGPKAFSKTTFEKGFR